MSSCACRCTNNEMVRLALLRSCGLLFILHGLCFSVTDSHLATIPPTGYKSHSDSDVVVHCEPYFLKPLTSLIPK